MNTDKAKKEDRKGENRALRETIMAFILLGTPGIFAHFRNSVFICVHLYYLPANSENFVKQKASPPP
jgi:hypothetical protein